jgi:hypothetical protein
MQGRRLPDGPLKLARFSPGDYMKVTYDDGTTHWYCYPERGYLGNLDGHQVTEHDDGTITVSPSILISDPDPSNSWHGYLEHGVWREV